MIPERMEQRRKGIIEIKNKEKKRLRRKQKSTGDKRDNLEDTKHCQGGDDYGHAGREKIRK